MLKTELLRVNLTVTKGGSKWLHKVARTHAHMPLARWLYGLAVAEGNRLEARDNPPFAKRGKRKKGSKS